MLQDLFKLTFKNKAFITSFAEVKILQVIDGEIEYCTLGSNESACKLILVMGYAATLNGWDLRFLSALANKFEIVVFSNRNTGNSKFESNNYKLKDLADDVEKLRTGLGFNKITILGISLGGVIAQNYAYYYPQNLNKLILINTLPPGYLLTKPKIETQEVLKSLNKKDFLSYISMLRLLFPNLWQASAMGIFHFKPYNSKNIIPPDSIMAQQEVIQEWVDKEEPESILKKILTKTLIIVGGKDQVIPAVNAETLNKHLVNSSIKSFPDGGHVLIYQFPKTTAQVIIEFIKSN